MGTPEQRLIDIDGATLEVFLDGTGDPIVCMSHSHTANTVERLAYLGWESTMGRLVAVNPRGVGQSSSEQPADFRWDQQLDDLEAVRRRLGIERWVFWGYSGGGCIGLLYALHSPRALGGLIIAHMGPSARRITADPRSVLNPHHPQNEQALARLGSVQERHPTILGADGALGPSAEWVHLRDDHPLEWVLTQDGAPLYMWWDTDARMKASAEEFVSRFETRERLGEIQIPTLVVAGRQDEYFPVRHVEMLHAGLPRAELLMLEESGHGSEPGTTDHATYRATVRSFLTRVATTAATESPCSMRFPSVTPRT